MCILNLFWQQLLPHKAVYCVIMLRCVVFKKGKKMEMKLNSFLTLRYTCGRGIRYLITIVLG